MSAPPASRKGFEGLPLRCPGCGATLPVAVLRSAGPVAPSEAELHVLFPQDYRIGRGASQTLRVRGSRRVSRSHASLTWSGDGFEIRDRGSTHGTFVNGEPLVPGAGRRLADGDKVRLGELEFAFNLRFFPSEG